MTIITIEPYATKHIIDEFPIRADMPFAYDVQFIMGKGSQLTYFPLITGGSTVDIRITLILADDAHAHVSGLYVLQGNQEYTITTRQHHQGKNATSNLAINGVVADHSKVTYSGVIVVEKDACKTVARQENKTILWSPHARVISIPALEVHTNDVHCMHGSAMGPLNSEHIFYVQSRGLSRVQAKRLLLKSFLAHNGYIAESILDQLVSRIIGVE